MRRDKEMLINDIGVSPSCGYFEQEGTTLYEAQCRKAERILEKLDLHKGMALCDIGCSWGFLLIEAAKKYQVHGVGMVEHVGRGSYEEFIWILYA